MKLRRVQLRANKLLVLAAVTNELGDDAGAGASAPSRPALGRALGKKFDRAVLSGTGAGMPLGLLNAPATITVSKEVGQAAATFYWDNATRMWSRLAVGCHENAVWLAHPTTPPQLLSMNLPIGTGGVQPAAAFAAGGPTAASQGRLVVITSRVKALGTKGDVILVDPTQVAIGIRWEISIEKSEYSWILLERRARDPREVPGDAQPMWEKARTRPEGSETESPDVTLETRS